MLMTRCVIATAVVLMALGCADQTASRVTGLRPTELSADRASDGADGKAVQAIHGHADFVASVVASGEIRYEVEAKQSVAKGTQGEFEWMGVSEPRFRIHGTVFCFTVVGNTAHIAGLVEHSSNPNVHPGDYLVWSFVDNDATKHGPDLSTAALRVPQEVGVAQCAGGVNTGPYFPVRGRLEVSPEAGEGHNK